MKLIEAVSADGKRLLSKKGRSKKKVRNRARAAALLQRVAHMPAAEQQIVLAQLAKLRGIEYPG